jgi:hypothetical protein
MRLFVPAGQIGSLLLVDLMRPTLNLIWTPKLPLALFLKRRSELLNYSLEEFFHGASLRNSLGLTFWLTIVSLESMAAHRLFLNSKVDVLASAVKCSKILGRFVYQPPYLVLSHILMSYPHVLSI